MVESDNTEVGPMSLNDTTDKNIKSNLTKKALRNVRFALPKHSHPLKLIKPSTGVCLRCRRFGDHRECLAAGADSARQTSEYNIIALTPTKFKAKKARVKEVEWVHILQAGR